MIEKRNIFKVSQGFFVISVYLFLDKYPGGAVRTKLRASL